MENKKTIASYKKIGESPLDLINRLREEQPELKDKKMAYAGRLDPIAEGLVLIVIGEELKNFDDYLKLNKEYEAKVLFGFSSDTYDILGIAQKKNPQKISEREAGEILKKMEGEFSFSLPPFSGYKIRKKPLFWWALKDRMGDVQIPEKKAVIYSLEILGTEYVDTEALKKEIMEKIKKVKGDFRQKEIVERWEKIFEEEKGKYIVVKIKVSCSSGCYIRSIANEVGERLGTGAILLHLRRVGFKPKSFWKPKIELISRRDDKR